MRHIPLQMGSSDITRFESPSEEEPKQGMVGSRTNHVQEVVMWTNLIHLGLGFWSSM
jgi:hypothetical protein